MPNSIKLFSPKLENAADPSMEQAMGIEQQDADKASALQKAADEWLTVDALENAATQWLQEEEEIQNQTSLKV